MLEELNYKNIYCKRPERRRQGTNINTRVHNEIKALERNTVSFKTILKLERPKIQRPLKNTGINSTI